MTIDVQSDSENVVVVVVVVVVIVLFSENIAYF